MSKILEISEVLICKDCKECGDAKELCEFRSYAKNDETSYEDTCKKCVFAKRTLTIITKSKGKTQEKDKAYYSENKEKINSRNTKYYAKNKEKIRARRKQYYKDNPEIHKEQRKNFLSNVKNKIAMNLRRRTRSFLHSGKGWSELLDCNFDHFMKWLKFNFDKEDGDMTLENYGKVWEMDHVNPLSKFDMENKDDVKIAFNWQNILPALCSHNKEKNNKILKEDIEKLQNRLIEFNALNSS
jgi:hypothetical protein